VNNSVLAKVLFTNKLATREQIAQFWPRVVAGENIAYMLRDAGILDAAVCEQVIAFVAQMDGGAPAPVVDSVSPPVDVSEVVNSVVATVGENTSSAVGDEPPLLTAFTAEASQDSTPTGDPLAIEGNNPYGSMLGEGQVVPIVDGLESNRIADVSALSSSSEPVVRLGLPKRYALVDGAGSDTETPPRKLDSSSSLRQLIAFGRQKLATDIYLQPDTPILMRRAGKLLMASESVHSAADVERWIGESAVGSCDGTAPTKWVGSCRALGFSGLGRVRMTVEWSAGAPLVSLRLLPLRDFSLHELGLPDFCQEWPAMHGGLVLIAGPAASGRTTTLYALGKKAADLRGVHLRTLENPVERLLDNPRGMLVQTEVGTHVVTVAEGLRQAIEDAPDVFLFDNMRGYEELSSLLQLANCGSLVIATTLGNNAHGLLTRLLESAPIMQRDVLRNQLAELLRAVACQHLLPLQTGNGMILATEAFRVTPGIASLLRKNDLQQIPAAIAGLKPQGQTLDDSLARLVDAGSIAGSEAWLRASDTQRATVPPTDCVEHPVA